MRSLSPLALALAPLPLPPAALAPDPESAALFVAAESPAPPGVRVDLFVLAPPSPPQLLASFTAPLASFHSPPHSPPETLALHYLPDERSLVIILAGGDIATLALDNPHVRLFFFSLAFTDTDTGRGRRQRRQRYQGRRMVARRRANHPRHRRRHARLYDQKL